jgi:hypothetical protein
VKKLISDLAWPKEFFVYLILLTLFPSFFYILFAKGLWGFEEASHYFPLEALSSLQSTSYSFGTNVVSGNSANMIPLGFIFGALQTVVSNAMLPFWITSVLAMILMASLFLFSGIFLKNKAIRVTFVLSVTFSFVFLNTVMYISKTSGVVFFLLMVLISTCRISNKWRILTTIIVSVLTLGMCANLAILLLGHSYVLFVIAILPPRLRWNFNQIRPLIFQTLSSIMVQVPVLWVIYFRNGELLGYSEFAKQTTYFFGATKNFLNGEGYWLQFESFGKIPYFDFMPKSESDYYEIHFWSMMLVLLVPIGYRLGGYITGSKILTDLAKICSYSRMTNMNILRVLGLLGLIIFLNFESNPLAFLMKHFLALRAFRDPWTKFEIYFYILLVLWTFIILEKIYVESMSQLKSHINRRARTQKVIRKRVIRGKQSAAIRLDGNMKFLKISLATTLVLYSTYYVQFPVVVLASNLQKPPNYRDFPLIAPGNSLQPLIESVKDVGQAWSNSDSTKPLIICNISGNPGIARVAEGFLPFIVKKQPNFIESERMSLIKSNQQVFDCGKDGRLVQKNNELDCSPEFRNLEFALVLKSCLLPNYDRMEISGN